MVLVLKSVLVVFSVCYGIAFADTLSPATTTIEVVEVAQELSSSESKIVTLDDVTTQDLVDWTFSHLLSTSLGRKIGRTIFEGCDPTLLHIHLGTSLQNPYLDQERCRRKHNYLDLWVKPDTRTQIELNSSYKRSVEVIVYPEELKAILPYDSWTDLDSKKTTIFLASDLSRTQIFTHLAKTLAHETAIYLDGKANVTKVRFSDRGLFGDTDLLRSYAPATDVEMNEFITAAQNPVIQYISSYIRAFKVERAMMIALDKNVFGQGVGSEYFNTNLLPFLSHCDQLCVQTYFGRTSVTLGSKALPLLKSTSYASSKRNQLVSRGLLSSQMSSAAKTLSKANRIEIPEPSVSSLLNLSGTPEDRLLSETNGEVADALNTFLLRDDLIILLGYNLEKSALVLPALEWLLTPTLSNTGNSWGNGARPRIVSSRETIEGSSTTGSQSTGLIQPFDGDTQSSDGLGSRSRLDSRVGGQNGQ